MPLPPSFEAFANEELVGEESERARAVLYVSYGELEFDTALRGHDAPVQSPSRPSFLDELGQFRQTILLSLQHIVSRLAAADRVILVGAGSQLLLAETPGVLRVKIVAPEEIRISRLATAYGLLPGDAQAAIRRSDQEQREYNRVIFGVDWDDPQLWDLVVNTETMSAAAVCELVSAAVATPEYAPGVPSKTRSALAACSRINEAFWKDPTLSRTSVLAVVTGISVALRGSVSAADDHHQALRLAESVTAGVPVVDEIRIPT
jgi:cytidylate kinase